MPNIGWPTAHTYKQFDASKLPLFGVIRLVNIFYDHYLLHFIYSTSHYPIGYSNKWSISKLHVDVNIKEMST